MWPFVYFILLLLPYIPSSFFVADEEEKLTLKVVALAWMNVRNKRVPWCTWGKGREGTMRPRGVWRVLYREFLQWETASTGGYSVFSVLIKIWRFYVRSFTVTCVTKIVTTRKYEYLYSMYFMFIINVLYIISLNVNSFKCRLVLDI